jgi:hypothetical protein
LLIRRNPTCLLPEKNIATIVYFHIIATGSDNRRNLVDRRHTVPMLVGGRIGNNP